MRMSNRGWITVLAALAMVIGAASVGGFARQERAGTVAPVAPVVSFAEPGISPDGKEVAFASGGDIWTVAANGGDARLLVSHSATESRPLFSPDGRRLAFMSTRTGGGDIYVLTLGTGEVTRLTFDDGEEQLDGWSRDGRWIYFSSASRDIASMSDVYRVSAEGGTPMPVSADRYVAEYFSAPAPDGRSVALTARGMAGRQWWRNGHSHIDESEIWLWKDGAPPTYERLTAGGAKEMWPMWAPDGRTLFYVSDRSGAQNVWARGQDGQPRQVTAFRDGRVLWPSISADGGVIAFERDFRIWTLETKTGRAAELKIVRRGAPQGPGTEHVSLTNQIQELALSPDGRKVAFVVRGEVFAASAKDGGDAARVTRTVAAEAQVSWSPDSRKVIYASDRDGAVHLFMYDFASNGETQLTRDAGDDAWPAFSPDGKLVAFQRDGREIRLLDLESKVERLVAKGYYADRLDSGRPMVWSPDGKWLACLATVERGFTNVQVVAAAGGDARPVSFLANSFGNTVDWSPDGTFIVFDTAQRTELGQVARVDLVLRTPKFREDLFRDLFRDEAPRQPAQPGAPGQEKSAPVREPAATSAPKGGSGEAPGEGKKPAEKPVSIVFDGIRQRLALVPAGVDVSSVIVSPDGKTLLLSAGAAGQQNLYTYSIDELAKERPVARQLTSTSGAKSDAQFSPDGKEVFYLEDGRIQVVALDRREPRPLAVTAEMDVDFTKDRLQVFRQAWSYLNDEFFDPKFHGVDWAKTRAAYEPYVAGASTPDEVRRLISLMIGELNASHLGISGPGAAGGAIVGRLGMRFDRSEYETAGRLKITDVIPLGPAAVSQQVKPGDYVTGIDGQPVGVRASLDDLLANKIGKRVVLTMASAPTGTDRKEVAVRPVNQSTEKGLIYREWVEANRAYVARTSGGRLGYVHMIDMGAGSLAQLFVDLDAENHTKDGVVIDIRNNNGGFVNAYAIDVFARRAYLTMTQRGLPSTPARTTLGQRALEVPTILVTNQHSLSDAEDFTEGYRTLRLGKVVGEPTAGWIIYTWSVRLIDGSSFRLPRTRITTNEGADMEMHPRPVDVPATRPIGESYTGKDSQLDAAVTTLLAQLGQKK